MPELYPNQGTAFSRGGVANVTVGSVWYVVTHANKSSLEFTTWEEMLVYMDASTYDVYYVQKDKDGVVPASYSFELDEPNSGYITQMKSLGGSAFYMLITPAEADIIRADWDA